VYFAYDGRGNLLRETKVGQVRSYAWDLDYRLRQITDDQGLTSQFDYDATGLRTTQVTPAGTTRYLIDGASVLEEFDASGTPITQYLRNLQSLDEILSFQQGSQTYYPLTDLLGSIQAITNDTGVVVRTNSYDVYGERVGTSGPGPALAFGYTGREHDPSGLNYHRDRYLDVRTGRWLQPDRLGEARMNVRTADVEATAPLATAQIRTRVFRTAQAGTYSPNLFRYSDNPVQRIDPFGLAEDCVACPQGKWFGSPLAFVEMALGGLPVLTSAMLGIPIPMNIPLASITFEIVLFGGVYSCLSHPSQYFVLALLGEAFSHVEEPSHFGHFAFGIGFGYEADTFKGKDFEDWLLEGVFQIGPIVGVLGHHGWALFISNEMNFGFGGLVNIKTWAWDMSRLTELYTFF
jgi:RHS repeat-associated protein